MDEPNEVEVQTLARRPRATEFTWSAHHLHTRSLPVRSWSQVASLVSNGGTPTWPWLTVRAPPDGPYRRYAHCFGFTNALSVEVSEWDPETQREHRWRLGVGELSDRLVVINPLAEDVVRSRTSQILTVSQAAMAVHDWPDLGRVTGFTLEAIDS